MKESLSKVLSASDYQTILEILKGESVEIYLYYLKRIPKENLNMAQQEFYGDLVKILEHLGLSSDEIDRRLKEIDPPKT